MVPGIREEDVLLVAVVGGWRGGGGGRSGEKPDLDLGFRFRV
jgi:hypothetical protein